MTPNTATMKQVTIHTDGSCLGNPGPGGWAALLRHQQRERLLAGGEVDTTNNRMELRAAIEALQALREPCKVELHTDSEYLRRGILDYMPRWQRNGWKTAAGKPVMNQDLWLRLLEVMRLHQVDWRWVRAHAGHADNERVDLAAREAARAQASERPA